LNKSQQQLEALIASNPKDALAKLAHLNRYLITPHSGGQIEVDRATERFQVVCAGRRWGKTKIAVKKALRECRKDSQMVWWVSPTYKVVRRAYREALKQIPPNILSKPAPPATADGRLLLHFKSGSIMEFYSAENPDAMVGEGVNYVVVDEAALIKEAIWTQVLRPTLMDTEGGAFLISTPRGQNWFKENWERGQDTDAANFKSWHFATSDNPFIKPSEIEEMRKTMPASMYEQEVLAQFVSNSAAVFRIPEMGIKYELEEPKGHVVLGIDLAKSRDFTVLTAVNSETRLPCYHDRFTAVSWTDQRQIIADAVVYLEELGCSVTIMIDSTGVGDVFVENLEEDGFDVNGIVFTNKWKEQAVKLLGAEIEQGKAFILEEQRHEFDSYNYTITAAGKFTYSAPTGRHDDEVSAKLLEHWGLVHFGSPNVRLMNTEGGTAPDEQDTSEQEIVLKRPSRKDLLNKEGVWDSH
jgi:hypothetical protein